MHHSVRSQQIQAASGSVLIWIGIGTLAYRELENWSWIESLYFSVVTLTTIGYGDLHPTTDISRLFTVFYILFGVVTVVSAISIVGAARIQQRSVGKRKVKRPTKS